MDAPNDDRRRKCRNRFFLVLVVLHVPIHVLPDMHMVLRNTTSVPFYLSPVSSFLN
jgi:hypothetical protein